MTQNNHTDSSLFYLQWEWDIGPWQSLWAILHVVRSAGRKSHKRSMQFMWVPQQITFTPIMRHFRIFGIYSYSENGAHNALSNMIHKGRSRRAPLCAIWKSYNERSYAFEVYFCLSITVIEVAFHCFHSIHKISILNLSLFPSSRLQYVKIKCYKSPKHVAYWFATYWTNSRNSPPRKRNFCCRHWKVCAKAKAKTRTLIKLFYRRYCEMLNVPSTNRMSQAAVKRTVPKPKWNDPDRICWQSFCSSCQLQLETLERQPGIRSVRKWPTARYVFLNISLFMRTRSKSPFLDCSMSSQKRILRLCKPIMLATSS